MGLNYYQMEKLNDYLSYNWGFSNRRDDYHRAVEFFGSTGFDIFENYSLDFEFAYSINSFNNSFGVGSYEFEYSMVMPSLLFNYFSSGSGYRFIFGAGGGYNYARVDEKIPGNNEFTRYNSKGFIVKFKVEANTTIGTNLFVSIAGDLRFGYMSDVASDKTILKVKMFDDSNLNLDFHSLGLKIGLKYIFN